MRIHGELKSVLADAMLTVKTRGNFILKDTADIIAIIQKHTRVSDAFITLPRIHLCFVYLVTTLTQFIKNPSTCTSVSHLSF